MASVVRPFSTGIAFAVTVGVFHPLCALVWALAPGAFLSFMNNLFHGMDFSSMVQTRPFEWPGFLALAKSGPYARIRHPQYVAFVLILVGFLLQWPTLLTLVMFPILLVMYARLATTEEAEMGKRFGAEFEAYAARTPRFLPSLRKANVGVDLKT